MGNIKINKDSLEKSYAYPLSIYTNVREDIVNLLYETRYLVSDILPDSYYQNNIRQDDNIKYLKVNTTNNDGCIIIPVNKEDIDKFNFIKNSDQDIKRIELTIIDRDLKEIYFPSIFYSSDNEIYINPNDLHIISMFSTTALKHMLISATTEKVIIDRFKIRRK